MIGVTSQSSIATSTEDSPDHVAYSSAPQNSPTVFNAACQTDSSDAACQRESPSVLQPSRKQVTRENSRSERENYNNRKSRNKVRYSSPPKPRTVKIQPWMSSTVWDHGPTLSFRKDQSQNESLRPKNHARSQHKTGTTAVYSRQNCTTQKTVTVSPSDSKAVVDTVRSVWASKFDTSPQQKPGVLGGIRHAGSPLHTVRNVWTERNCNVSSPSLN